MIVDEDGEILEPYGGYKKPGSIVKVIDPTDTRRRIKHFQLRDSREAKRAMNKLTIEESGLLVRLLQYVDWGTNKVVGDGDTIGTKGKPLKMYEIDKLCGISKSTRVKLIDSLEKKNAIKFDPDSGKTKILIINPLYGYKGNKPPVKYAHLFSEHDDADG